MFIELLRLILGYVEFSAAGGFPERFINLCTVNGIVLWNVKNDGVKVCACTSIGGYKMLRKPARNSGMRLKIVKKRGLPFFTSRNKLRIGAALGALAAILFIVFMSGFVWEVEFDGISTVKAEYFSERVAELGVYTGARKSKIDEKAISETLLDENPALSWVSVNIFGGKVVVEMRETEEAPFVADKKKPVNIVAAKDAQIILMECYSGTRVVKGGDIVCKGDLLISGVTANADGTEKLIRASGRVTASTVTLTSYNQNYKFKSGIIADSRQKLYLYLFGFKVPLSFGGDGTAEYSTILLAKGGKSDLPIGLSREVFFEKETADIELNDNEAFCLALLKTVKATRLASKNIEINKSDFSRKKDVSGITVSSRIEGKEDIAEEKEIIVDGVGENLSEN